MDTRAKRQRRSLARLKIGENGRQPGGEAVGVEREQVAPRGGRQLHRRTELFRWPDGRDDDRIDDRDGDVRHGYDGINDEEFLPLVTVKVGDLRRKGWVHLPQKGGFPVAVQARVRAS